MDMRGTIDERIKDIALKFGSVVPNSKLHQFPKELSALSNLLFHLRRGPLLGSIIGHEDERSFLRNLFLNASSDLSLRMVAPRCLMHREGALLRNYQLMTLQCSLIQLLFLTMVQMSSFGCWELLSDCYSHAYIKLVLGAELAADEGRSAAALAACRTLAEEITELRFLAPRILAFKEGTSQARYFVSRLIPAHKDPPYEQEARFPQLRSLTIEQRMKLKTSFIHFDDPSFSDMLLESNTNFLFLPPSSHLLSSSLFRAIFMPHVWDADLLISLSQMSIQYRFAFWDGD
ncbi:hypothetical protein POTOM_010685 [Populus tomentosa]|uniref:Protein transport protein SEC23 n=1 Tax=Populus tomentosa TaxID=118781 RepID=A0A8X8D2H1_POPTO|nr:hypothetical protein POTOM_010685 [Populus tomentosa]